VDIQPLVRMKELLKKSLTKLENEELDELGQMGAIQAFENTARKFSDLDICYQEEIPLNVISHIRAELEESGTGKSTIACLLVEYFDYKKQKVQLVDTDPIQTSQTWANNCREEAQTDLILVPFRPHYADLQTTITWFTSLKPSWQSKIIFIPNHWQNTKEQREGLEQLKKIIQEEGQGKITNPLANRPALYGTLLNGSKDNFFQQPNLPGEI
ncbi:15156_t:CDS:2, partial [Cetraspora pellucida]